MTDLTAPEAPVTRNREAWLGELAYSLEGLVQGVTGKAMPKYRISVSFPSRGAMSSKKRVVGQCWDGLVSSSGHSELFISPLLEDPMIVAGVVIHEMIHANVGCSFGHGKEFSQVARAVGLDGKPTATVPGEKFIKIADPILQKLGQYPHTALVVNPNRTVQKTLMHKVRCAKCGYVLRTTDKWLKIAAPICPIDFIPMSKVEKE